MVTALIFVVTVAVAFLLSGMKLVRSTHCGLIERLRGYESFSQHGFHWIIPLMDRIYQSDITKCMVAAKPQEIITRDKLNAMVETQVYFSHWGIEIMRTELKKLDRRRRSSLPQPRKQQPTVKGGHRSRGQKVSGNPQSCPRRVRRRLFVS